MEEIDRFFETNITIPRLLKYKMLSGEPDLSSIPEYEQEYDRAVKKPQSISELVLLGLKEFDEQVHEKVSSWYGKFDEPKVSYQLKNQQIYAHVEYLMEYVLDAKLGVCIDEVNFISTEDLNLVKSNALTMRDVIIAEGEIGVNHDSYRTELNPELNISDHDITIPGKLEDSVWAVLNFWLLGEKLLGMKTKKRSLSVRSFAVFAATAFIRFRIDSGHWGEFTPEINSESEFESTFTYAEIGLLLGLKKHIRDDINACREQEGFRKISELKQKSKNRQYRSRIFNESYNNGSDAISMTYTEVKEYFHCYLNQVDQAMNLTHSEAVYYLKNHSNFKFTEFYYKDLL